MKGPSVLSVILSTVIAITHAASVTEINRVSNLMSAAYQLKARLEMQKLEGLAFQARTLAKLQKIRADLELREEKEMLEHEQVRCLAPKGIQGAPGPVGIAGEPGEPGPPGAPGSFGVNGQDGTVSETSLLQDVSHIRALTQLNRNYLDQLLFTNLSTFGTCAELIALDQKETFKLKTSCSWVLWPVHGSGVRVKVTGLQNGQQSLTAFDSNQRQHSVYSWGSDAIQTPYVIIHYRTKSTCYNQPTLEVEEIYRGYDETQHTSSFVYPEPFELSYPLPPATTYRNRERTFIVGNAVCGKMPTVVRIYDVDIENEADWLETYWLAFDTTTTPSQIQTQRVTGRSVTTVIIPPSTSFMSRFKTDAGVTGRGFKIRAECRQ